MQFRSNLESYANGLVRPLYDNDGSPSRLPPLECHDVLRKLRGGLLFSLASLPSLAAERALLVGKVGEQLLDDVFKMVDPLAPVILGERKPEDAEGAIQVVGLLSHSAAV